MVSATTETPTGKNACRPSSACPASRGDLSPRAEWLVRFDCSSAQRRPHRGTENNLAHRRGLGIVSTMFEHRHNPADDALFAIFCKYTFFNVLSVFVQRGRSWRLFQMRNIFLAICNKLSAQRRTGKYKLPASDLTSRIKCAQQNCTGME